MPLAQKSPAYNNPFSAFFAFLRPGRCCDGVCVAALLCLPQHGWPRFALKASGSISIDRAHPAARRLPGQVERPIKTGCCRSISATERQPSQEPAIRHWFRRPAALLRNLTHIGGQGGCVSLRRHVDRPMSAPGPAKSEVHPWPAFKHLDFSRNAAARCRARRERRQE